MSAALRRQQRATSESAVQPATALDPATSSSLEPGDLAEIMGAFTSVTERLQTAHHALEAEVRRLNGELRTTNEQLRRSRQLAALGQMAAGIAHEVRNPLASIRLYASILAEDLNDRPESCRLAKQIARAVGDLDAVVGDVLTFARELTIRPAQVSVPDLFDQAVESCRGLLHGSGVEVRRDPAAESALGALVVDASLINQALVNLLRNAFEAMEGHGTITLSTKVEQPADAEILSDGPTICLVVDDTGPGIDESIVERIFNPFFTTRPTGTGLGLAIVHRILDAHSGGIEIGRNISGGASILLRLPASLRKPNPADASGQQPSSRIASAPQPVIHTPRSASSRRSHSCASS